MFGNHWKTGVRKTFWVAFLVFVHSIPATVFSQQALTETQHAGDIVFVIDNSGSMRKNDPGFMIPDTVEAFLGRLAPQTRVGLVLFDEKARLLSPLQAVDDPAARRRLIAGLDDIDYKGRYTNSAAGIERALYELKTQGREQVRRSIVFITDGIMDTGDGQKDIELTQWLKNDLTGQSRGLGSRIFGIAFTENADYALIQALAARTDGDYYRADRPDDIAAALGGIQARLTAPDDISEPEPAAVVSRPALAPSPPAPGDPAGAAPAPATVSSPAPEPTTGQKRYSFSLILLFLVLCGAVLLYVYRYRASDSRDGSRKREAETAQTRRRAEPRSPEWRLCDLANPGQPARDFTAPRATIGRDAKNDLVIAGPTISNLHAVIAFKEGAFFLEDVRSTNGTRLNDRRVGADSPVRLKSGDRISFAGHEYKFVRMDQLISGDTIMLSVTELGEDRDDDAFELPPGVSDEERKLNESFRKHLAQIISLGPKYKTFADLYFKEETVRALSVQAYENLQQTKADGELHCSPLVKGRAFFVICTLPVDIAGAARWYGRQFGGFTQFIFKWIKSEAYDVTACDLFCVITFGHKDSPWVSMTIVPTHEGRDAVEIMSVDFLTEDEKRTMALDFDDHGRVI